MKKNFEKAWALQDMRNRAKYFGIGLLVIVFFKLYLGNRLDVYIPLTILFSISFLVLNYKIYELEKKFYSEQEHMDKLIELLNDRCEVIEIEHDRILDKLKHKEKNDEN